MAFDPAVRDRVLAAVADLSGVTGKPLFGCFGVFRDGTLFAGVERTALIVKLGVEGAADALLEPHTAGFDPMGKGKPMTGWVLVDPPAIASDEQLRAWLDRALAFIPKKKPAGKKKLAGKKSAAKKKA